MAGKQNVSREMVLSLLKKVGASFTDEIPLDRAIKKLDRYIHKSGIPEGYTKEEADALVALGIAQVDEPEEKAPKGKAPKAKASKEKKPSKEKESKPKGPRADWMTSATQAVLASKNMKQAAKTAVSLFKKAGGRMTDLSDKWGVLYTSYASKALIAAEVIKLDSDGNISK